MFKRHQKVTNVNNEGLKLESGIILGPEDFEDYDFNNPTRLTGKAKSWELVRYRRGDFWTPAKNLEDASVGSTG